MTCTECSAPVVARGLCQTHYQAQRRAARRGAGTLPPATKRRGVERISLRLPPETIAALDREAKRLKQSRFRVAVRWLEEKAALVRS